MCLPHIHRQTICRNTIHVSRDSVIESFNMEIPLIDAFQVNTSWDRHWRKLLSRRHAEYASLCVCEGDRVVFICDVVMVARKSVYCLYSCVCVCVWQWFLVCSWRLGASKICVVFCAGRETPDCVGVRCTDSWQTAAFPVILRSPPRLWPVMRSLWKILLLLGTCLNMSCRYQSNALDIPLEGKLNKWLSVLCIICVVFFFFLSLYYLTG